MSADGTLTAQANATRHTPPTSLTTWSSFRLSDFDLDKSNFTIEEWLEDASKLKGELGASDLVIIAKAGEALRGRGYRYYCDWRPIRGWEKFCKDLIIAFPDRETPDMSVLLRRLLWEVKTVNRSATTETRSFAAFIVFVMRVGDYTESNMALTMEKPPSGSDSQGMSGNSWSYSPKLMDAEANIKLWLARVLLTRWEQKALRVQQPNGQVGQDPFSAEVL
jgi:hypothetical protein